MIDDFLANFPYTQIRPQQQEILEKVSENWNSKSYFLIDAPTGVGKSAVARAIMGAVDRSYLLTSTKMLQDQYIGDYKEFASIKGQGNYTCNVNPHFRVDSAPCQAITSIKSKCMKGSVCDYYNARDKAIRSRFFLTSYHYFLMAVECGPLSDVNRPADSPDPKRAVLVCDEGHEMENILTDFGTTTIDPDYFRTEFKCRIRPLSFTIKDKVDANIDHVHEEVSLKLAELNDQIKSTLRSANEFSGSAERISPSAAAQVKQLVNKRDILDRFIKRLKVYYMSREDLWIKDPLDNGTKLKLTPTYPKKVYDIYVRRMADKHIIMSASLGDPDQFCKEHGIPKEDMVYICVDSPFDPKKSPIDASMAVIDLKYNEIDKNMHKVIETIDAIMDEHKNEKGIIHAGNYRITKEILESSSREVQRRLIGKGGGRGLSNEELFKMHAESPNPTVLVSPSMYEGIDLKGELSRFQIIVKLPWPNLQDSRVKVKKSDWGWYTDQMMKKVIQATGRSTRSEEDYSTTYILDLSFANVWKRNRSSIPEWLRPRFTGVK